MTGFGRELAMSDTARCLVTIYSNTYNLTPLQPPVDVREGSTDLLNLAE